MTKEKDGAGQPGFEAALARLEEIVEGLEGSEVPLEDALKLFEEGVSLGRACTKRLDEAERRITVLLEQADGSLAESPLEAGQAVESEAPAPSRSAARAPKATKPRKPAPSDDDGDDDGEQDDIPF